MADASPAGDFFPETLPQSTLDFTPERDRYGQVDIDALVTALPTLKVAQRVSQAQRFFHWELEFADQFRERKGFNLVLGNPPWIKVEWNEQALLSDFDPRFAIRGLTAKDATDQRNELLKSGSTSRRDYVDECVATEGTASFLNAIQNYPLLAGQQSNLYKCFLPVTWRIGSGVQGLIHPEGPYDDPRGSLLRRAMYPRLRAHYQFQNELKLFEGTNDHGRMRFSLNVFGQAGEAVSFRSISNLYWPTTIDASLEHSGGGVTPGMKRLSGGWNTDGHLSRVIRIDDEVLKVFSRLYDVPDSDPQGCRLPAIHSAELLSVVSKLGTLSSRLGDIRGDYCTIEMWHETAAQRDGTLKRKTGFVATPDALVMSGPHFFCGNPVYKTPRAICTKSGHYDAIELEAIVDDYLPRSNYVPATSGADHQRRIPRVTWLDEAETSHRLVTSYYRMVHRRQLNLSSERTFSPAIIPKGVGHIHPVLSTTFRRQDDMLRFVAVSMSLPIDFLVKSTGKSDLYESTLRLLPLPGMVPDSLRVRALGLNCLTSHYSELWSSSWSPKFRDDVWASSDPRIASTYFAALTPDWTRQVGLRSAFARRQAMLEVDTIVAQLLGLTLSELLTVYRVQFPILQQNELETWYDSNGRVVYTPNKALSGLALPRKAGRNDRPCKLVYPDGRTEGRRLGWDDLQPMPGNPRVADGTVIERSVQDDTHSSGPIDRKIRYVAPFALADREADYRTAWAHFEQRKKIH
jgi:hypothetical protein